MSYRDEADEAEASIIKRENAFGVRFIRQKWKHFFVRYPPGDVLDFQILTTRGVPVVSAELKSRATPSTHSNFRSTYLLNSKKVRAVLDKHPTALLLVHFVPDDVAKWIPFATPIAFERDGGRKDRGRDDDLQLQTHYWIKDFRPWSELPRALDPDRFDA